MQVGKTGTIIQQVLTLPDEKNVQIENICRQQFHCGSNGAIIFDRTKTIVPEKEKSLDSSISSSFSQCFHFSPQMAPKVEILC